MPGTAIRATGATAAVRNYMSEYKGQECTVDEIAEHEGLSKAQVASALQNLGKQGIVRNVRRGVWKQPARRDSRSQPKRRHSTKSSHSIQILAVTVEGELLLEHDGAVYLARKVS